MAYAASSFTPGDEQKGVLSPSSVIQYMKQIDFNINALWTRFMRLLGMRADDIIKYHQLPDYDIQMKLEDCLDEWIKNDPDFSWEKINVAVKFVNEHECAVTVFHLLQPELSQLIQECDDINVVTSTLEAEGVIDAPPMMEDGSVNKEQLFQSLEAFITQRSPHNLFKLIKLLTSKFQCFKRITALFELECQLCSLHEPPKENFIFVPLPAPKEDRISETVPLSPTLQGEFVEVIEEYHISIGEIIDSITERQDNDDIRRYLSRSPYCDDLERFAELSTKDILQSYFRRIASVTRTNQLKKFLRRFSLVEEVKKIEGFEKTREDVCATIKADKLINKTLGFMNIEECSKVTFTVKWEISEAEINEIEDILSLAFEELAINVHIKSLRKGNSFTITCYAHESIIGLLVFKAQKNLSALKKKGVILLKIGYCTLLDHKKKYEINASDTEEIIAQLKEDNEKLHSTIKQLQIVLHDHNIPLPTDLEYTDSDVQLESSSSPSTKEIEISAGDEKLKEELQSADGGAAEKSPDDDDDDWLPEEPVKRKPIDSFLQPTDVQEVTLIEAGHDDDDDGEALTAVPLKFMEQYKEFKGKAEQLKMKETIMKGFLLELEQHKAELEQHKAELKQHKEEKELTSSEILKLKDEKLSFESKIKELEESKEQAAGTLDNYKRRVPMLYDDGSHHYPPVDIRMTHFHRRRTKREYWYSPSFYSHPGGYKLCIRLAPAGQDQGEGTHLSMFVHVMSGDHDATLPWPFHGVINVQLRNQRGDHTHIEATVRYDESASKEASDRVISGFKTASGTASLRGVGEAKFISYEDLVRSDSAKMSEYLKDDEVIIRVTEVTVNQQMVLPTRSLGGAEPIPSIEYIAKLVVPNFTKLKDKNQKWESPPFYTRPNNTGYKFLLAVHANGKGKSKGTWVSIYTHLMRGEHDDKLRFPFRGVITVQLVNQRGNRDHVVSRIQYTDKSDPTGKRGGRISLISAANLVAGRSYGGWGYPTFVRHEHLTPYLTNNDELVFRITNVEDFSSQE